MVGSFHLPAIRIRYGTPTSRGFSRLCFVAPRDGNRSRTVSFPRGRKIASIRYASSESGRSIDAGFKYFSVTSSIYPGTSKLRRSCFGRTPVFDLGMALSFLCDFLVVVLCTVRGNSTRPQSKRQL